MNPPLTNTSQPYRHRLTGTENCVFCEIPKALGFSRPTGFLLAVVRQLRGRFPQLNLIAYFLDF